MTNLDVPEIISALNPGYWRVHHFNLIDSTQTSLVAALSSGRAAVGDVYLAEFQSAGKGRLDRRFESAASDSVLVSLAISPKHQPQSRWGWVPLVAGVAAASAIMESTGISASLKWPNDVMINDKKAGGIIAEKIDDVIVLGIGINCMQSENNLPAPGATSLSIHSDSLVNRNAVVISLLNAVARFVKAWDEKPLPVENKYRQLSATLEQRVKALLPDGSEIVEKAIAISSEGALVLANGRELVAGDVTHIRADK